MAAMIPSQYSRKVAPQDDGAHEFDEIEAASRGVGISAFNISIDGLARSDPRLVLPRQPK